jgi:hypothetical protein
MFSKWYLVLFILTLIVLLFVVGYNIYEHYQIKKNCPNQCSENTNMLFWLNIIVMVLIFILIIGFFFARDKNTEQVKASGLNVRQQPVNQQPLYMLPQGSYPQQSSLNQVPQQHFTQQPAQQNFLTSMMTGNPPVGHHQVNNCNENPLANGIDIISRV